MISLALEREGFSVVSAGSASEAIALTRTLPGDLDLLVSDVDMPGMNGVALAETLRATSPDLPVILISGGCEPACVGPQRSRFLPKPFTLGALTEIAHSLVDAPDPAERRLSQAGQS